MQRKYKPPKCPYCKVKLTTLYENTYETYCFDEHTGNYKEKDTGDLIVKCFNCEEDLTEIFNEGACNYQSDSIF